MFAKGKRYKNFLVTKVLPIEELMCTLVECTHEPTGAEIIKLITEDEENLFALSFRTWPTKSDGIAHILEHTVLCGSKKYPVKDPFFGMTRRSLNTYMNALTGGDFTCYPAATCVRQDFYNLLSVYLDAVFQPILNPLSFMQEGHRLELQERENASSPLIYKGIVFNEMKGALGSKEARLTEEIMHSLYPDITYGVNSGGDPKVIPELTYKELKEFHQTYYHPSRCTFFFYGNLPFEEQLDYLEENALKGVEKKEPLVPLPSQKRRKKKESLIRYYPATAEKNEERVVVALCYLTCSILEQEELLALNVVDLLLMGTDASPLKRALLQSNLCKQADSYVDNEMNDTPFIIICKGCKEESAPKIEALIEETLEEVIKEGFSDEMIEGALHQLEMARSEITGGSSPYALSLFFRSILLKQHGGHVEDGLQIHSHFAKLRKWSKESYLTLLKKHFLQNGHSSLIEMRPDESLAKKEEEEEIAKLSKIKESLSKKELHEIDAKSKELERFQEESEEASLACLPKLGLADVAKKGKEFALTTDSFGPLTLHAHSCFTNQLFYTDLIFDLPKLQPKEMPFARLFCFLLSQVGSGGRSYKENLDFMLQHTGGVSAFFDLGQHVANPEEMHPFFCLRGKALNRKSDKLFTLLHDTIASPDFSDARRIGELLMQHLHALDSSIQRSPLRYGINLAASNFSAVATLTNRSYGLPYYWWLKESVAEYQKNPTPLLQKFAELKERILAPKSAELVVTADEEMLGTLKREKLYGLETLCQKGGPLWEGEFTKEHVKPQAREISTPVSFTTLLFPTISYKDKEAAALLIGSEIMENLLLHPTIREKGGAYGSGAVFSLLHGQFYFYTYRDPHIASSVNACKKSIDLLCKGSFSEEDVEQAKLQIFQDLDAPLPPCARAYTAYTRLRSGRTPEVRQAFRDRLFAAGQREIKKAAEHHLKKQVKESVLVTFAGKELLKKEASDLPCFSIGDTHV